jgi:HPt (histidine-containing phosphotransfer) domain-containing protein
MRPFVAGRASHTSSSAPASTAPLPFSIPGFDLAAACDRLGGNAGLLVDLLRTFAMEHHSCAADVEALLKQQHPATAAAALHRMKSAARIIGAQALAAAADALETDIRHGRSVDTTAFAAMLADVVDSIGKHAVIAPPVARPANRSDANLP